MSLPPAELPPSGVYGLDSVLTGGFTKGQTYLVQGEPGTDTTTPPPPFALEGARCGGRTLRITISRRAEDLDLIARSHGWEIGPDAEHPIEVRERFGAEVIGTLAPAQSENAVLIGGRVHGSTGLLQGRPRQTDREPSAHGGPDPLAD
jgi:KaiC/GvpD/RAD55 family RecA-like ATPase